MVNEKTRDLASGILGLDIIPLIFQLTQRREIPQETYMSTSYVRIPDFELNIQTKPV